MEQIYEAEPPVLKALMDACTAKSVWTVMNADPIRAVEPVHDSHHTRNWPRARSADRWDVRTLKELYDRGEWRRGEPARSRTCLVIDRGDVRLWGRWVQDDFSKIIAGIECRHRGDHLQ